MNGQMKKHSVRGAGSGRAIQLGGAAPYRRARKPKEHTVKAWPDYFEDVVIGAKTAELRENDRDYREGDTILLSEYCPRLKCYSGKQCRLKVSGVLRDDSEFGKLGLRKGWCVLSTKLYAGTSFDHRLAGKKG